MQIFKLNCNPPYRDNTSLSTISANLYLHTYSLLSVKRVHINRLSDSIQY